VHRHAWGLVYVFLDTADLARERRFCEDVLGLPVIENQFHPPHHHHGLVKYDAGTILMSLNVAGKSARDWRRPDSFVTMLRSRRFADIVSADARAGSRTYAEGSLTIVADGDNHLFSAEESTGGPSVARLRLLVKSLADSVEFYVETLGMGLTDARPSCALVDAGNVELELVENEAAVADRRRDGYLIVFHSSDIDAAVDHLQAARPGSASRVVESDIGATSRVEDPSGHPLCLYVPSATALSWPSGRKVGEIIDQVSQRRVGAG
jgi:catechol 2,3-dioxygenase-like lactoylglutathione lyase family enzyme